jgi:hypothetical protein
MILLSIRVGNLGVTVVGETNNDRSLAGKLCTVDASRGMVNACLNLVSTVEQGTSEKTYRELSSNTTEVRHPRKVGDHECTGGSVISGEFSVGDCSITEILEVLRRWGIDIDWPHAVGQVA